MIKEDDGESNNTRESRTRETEERGGGEWWRREVRDDRGRVHLGSHHFAVLEKKERRHGFDHVVHRHVLCVVCVRSMCLPFPL